MTAANGVARTPFWTLVAANAVSMWGNALAQLAVPWFVLETTGSASKTGITAASGLLPFVLASFLGGVVVDRVGHRRASVIADISSMLAVGLIPLLHVLDALSFPVLVVLVFLGALLDTPGATARAALFPDVAGAAGLRLERANAIHEVIESGAGFAGPLLVGLLIAGFGASTALWINAGTFAISALLVAVFVPRGAGAADAMVQENDLAGPLGGLRFALHDPPIRSIFVSATVLNFLISPLLVVVLPYEFNARDSAAGLGLVIAAFGGGSVLGAIVYGASGHHWPRRRTFVTGVFAIGAAITALAFLPPTSIMTVAMLLGGLIAGPNGPLVQTVLQERTPPELRGRVFGASTAIGFAAAPLGVLAAGALIEATSSQVTLVGMAVVFLAVAAILAVDRGLRELDG